MKLLLDTTFVLPSLGVKTGEEALRALEKLVDLDAEIYCSRFAILESLWAAARLSNRAAFDAERFQLGLRSILEGGRYKKVEESSEIFNEALRLYRLGHKDMIDNILYATSAHLNLKLLTLDTKLKRFIAGKGLTDTLTFPSQIAR